MTLELQSPGAFIRINTGFHFFWSPVFYNGNNNDLLQKNTEIKHKIKSRKTSVRQLSFFMISQQGFMLVSLSNRKFLQSSLQNGKGCQISPPPLASLSPRWV